MGPMRTYGSGRPMLGASRRVGMGLYAPGTVDSAISQVDGAMSALQAVIPQCAQLNEASQIQWGGDYQGWQQLKTQWQSFKDASNVTNLYAPELYASDDTYAQVQAYQAKTVTWQQALKAACPASAPPTPAPLPTPQPVGAPNIPTWGQQVVDATKAVGILVAVGVGGYVVYKVAQVSLPLLAKA